MKQHWKALLTIIVSAVLYRFLEEFIPGKYNMLLSFIYLVMLLFIGYSLSGKQKKNNRWVGKVIISLLVVFIFGIRLNLFVFDEFYRILKVVGLSGKFLDLLLIYCGWVFYQI